MPNKTIYVSEDDLSLYRRAQELGGGNLSAAIAAALRRYVDIEEGKREGFDEITVRVGLGGARRKVRFSGVLLGEWVDSSWSRVDTYRVYRSRTGKYVLHTERSPEYKALDDEGKPAGILGQLGLTRANYSSRPAESTIEIFDTLDGLRDKVPSQLYDSVASVSHGPLVEDLDI